MNNKPFISVITPTYNRENLISRAIESVLNQTYKDFELIIVDDGSTDNTKEIVKSFQEKDNRIVYIYQENRGLSSALNKGLSVASGKYIAFLESDDEWLPQKLEKQIYVLEHYSSVYLVSCWAFRVFSDTSIKLFKTHKGIIKKEQWCHFFETGGIISPSTIIIRKEVFNIVGFFDTNLKAVVDLDFYIRFVNNFDIYFIPESLVNYYESSESLSKKIFGLNGYQNLNISEKNINLLLNNVQF